MVRQGRKLRWLTGKGERCLFSIIILLTLLSVSTRVRHPHKVQLPALTHWFAISRLYFGSPFSSHPVTNSFHSLPLSTPRYPWSQRLIWYKYKQLLISCGSTAETARHDHLLLPLAPPPTALPSMTGLAPPNMFATPPPSSQLQIDLALQATVPPQVSLAVPQ